MCPGCLQRELRLPWDDRVEVGVLRAWWRTSVRMMGSPKETLAHAQRPDSLGGSVLYALLSTLVGSAPSWLSCVGVSLLVTFVSTFELPDRSRPSTIVTGFGLLTLMAVFSAVTSEAVSVFIEHGVLLASGARPRLSTTVRAHALSMSPYLVGLVPFCGALICPLWAVALRVAAFKSLHGVATGPAVLAAVVPLLVLVALALVPFLI